MIQLGDLRIHLINDCQTRVDPGGAYGLVPRVLWSRYVQPDENQLIPTVQVCLLVQHGSENIVIDTGMGSRLSEKQIAMWQLTRPHGDLIAALGRLGVQPDDVNLVIDTHLHADHCAGNIRFDENGDLVPVFPKAEYVVQRREYEDAMRPNERTAATYNKDNWEVLMQNGQMRLLDGDVEIRPGVHCLVTRGHTPGHMSIRFESDGQHAAFLCDLATHAVHFERLGWMTAYDVEPLHTLETKRLWQKWALETNAILIFPHDVNRSIGRLSQSDDGKPQLIPMEEPFV